MQREVEPKRQRVRDRETQRDTCRDGDPLRYIEHLRLKGQKKDRK